MNNPALLAESRLRTLEHLKEQVTRSYSGELWKGVQAALGVVAALSLADRTNPLTLIFEGASGRGKSTIVKMFNPQDEGQKYLYRLDSFTPKSFVTQAANVAEEKLKEIDLLPKLKDKLLVTKELAPLFRGRDDELRSNFAVLTAVLDGKGHKSASGVHGTRGYEGKHVFNWIGGTTPIPARTDGIMAQLGNRLLRYEIVGEEQSLEELLSFARSYKPEVVEDKCRELVNQFVVKHFAEYPPNSVGSARISISEEQLKELVRLATLTAKGRVELSETDDGFIVASEPEAPYRLIVLLKTYALGLALLTRTLAVDEDVISFVRHVAFSSIPRERRRTLRAVLTAEGDIDSLGVEQVLKVSRPTARKYMEQLAATGIVDFTKGQSNNGDRVRISGDWAWLLPGAESEMQLCEEELVET